MKLERNGPEVPRAELQRRAQPKQPGPFGQVADGGEANDVRGHDPRRACEHVMLHILRGEWTVQVHKPQQPARKNKQQQQFTKEAMYSSEKMQKRMVSNDELNMSYNYDVENEKASYLRRKIERGKRF